MKVIKRFLSPVIIFLLASTFAYAQQSNEVTKKYKTDQPEEEDSFFESVTSAFDTPVIRGSLKAGTTAINRSIENLMDALFYKLMDREWILAKEGDLSLNLNTERNIYNAPTGDFVVVDRISIGPQYAKPLGKVADVTASLGVGLNADYYEIYPRSDALRATENSQDGFFTWAGKNWLGALPFISRIMPPSFNPNELYDPFRLVAPPFSVPLDKESFETMPISSIRSYAIRGGVNLPLALDEAFNPEFKKRLMEVNETNFSVPYSIFLNGEYRVNVLRKDFHTAWVGLSKSRSVGHGVFGILGKTIYVLKDYATTVPFPGLPLPFFPIDSDITSDITKTTSLLYEFDLNTKEGLEAYEKAVIGDFDFAFVKAQRKIKGIKYHFTKTENNLRAISKQAMELGLFANTDQRNSEEIENTIRDHKGKFYTLESKESNQLKTWDILVGETSRETNSKLTLHVKRIDANDDGSEWMYKYKNIKNPWLLSISARLFDSFTSGVEIKKYKSFLEDISGIKLWGFPAFSTTNKEVKEKIESERLTSHPYDRQLNFTPQPQLLGRFNAKLEALISTSQLKELYKHARKDFYKIYKKILEKTGATLPQKTEYSWASLYGSRFINLLLSPLRVVGIERVIDASESELEYRTSLLEEFNKIVDPEEHLDRFSELFETDFPFELTSAIVQTVGKYKAPRTLTLYTKAAKGLSPIDKLNFDKLNRLKYKRGKKFDYWDRYSVASKKTQAFNPLKTLSKRSRLYIKSASLQTNFREVKKKTSLPFQLKISLKGLPKNTKDLNVYLKFENAGKLDLGRLVLSEAVLEKRIGNISGVPSEGVVLVNLYEDEELKTFLLEQAINLSGDIKLTMALSDNRGHWSSLRTMTFTFRNNRLTLLD